MNYRQMAKDIRAERRAIWMELGRPEVKFVGKPRQTGATISSTLEMNRRSMLGLVPWMDLVIEAVIASYMQPAEFWVIGAGGFDSSWPKLCIPFAVGSERTLTAGECKLVFKKISGSEMQVTFLSPLNPTIEDGAMVIQYVPGQWLYIWDYIVRDHWRWIVKKEVITH